MGTRPGRNQDRVKHEKSRAEYGLAVETLCLSIYKCSRKVGSCSPRTDRIGGCASGESEVFPQPTPLPLRPCGILLAKARERRITVCRGRFTSPDCLRPFRKTRHRHVNLPVWENSRGESPCQAAYQNRAQIPDSFNYPHNLESPPTTCPLGIRRVLHNPFPSLHASLIFLVYYYFIFPLFHS